MQISIEITSSLGRCVTVTVPTEQVEQAVKNRLQNLGRTAKIDGFRPGKIPEKVIKERFGEAVRAESVEETIQSSLQETLKKENLHPAQRPEIQSLEAEEGKPLKYSVTFEVYPEIDPLLPNRLAKVALEKMVVTVADADIDDVLEKMRKQHTIWNEVERPAQMSDQVTFDVFVKTPDAEQPTKQQENAAVVLDAAHLPKGLMVLEGAKVGDEITLDLMPEQAKDEAGTQRPQFIAHINKIAEAQLPELDADFAEKLGIEGGMGALRDQVRKHLEQEVDAVVKNKLKKQVIDKLIELHPLELPKALVNAEAGHLEKELREKLQKEIGRDDIGELPAETKEKALETARRRVTISLLFAEIVRLQNLKVDEERVHKHVERIASQFEDMRATINLLYGYKDVMNSIRAQVMEEQVVEKLLEQVQFTEQPTAYADVVKLGAAGAGHAHLGHEHHVHDENCDHDHDHEHQHDHA